MQKMREYLISTDAMIGGKPAGDLVNEMSDEQLAAWLNEPEQKKLWEGVPSDYSTGIWGVKDRTKNSTEPPKHFLWNKGRQPGGLAKIDRYALGLMVHMSGLSPEMLFMHDAILAEDAVGEEIPLTYTDVYRTPDEWWTDSEIDQQRRILSQPAGDRADRYLKESDEDVGLRSI
jgi:hypothetical protein